MFSPFRAVCVLTYGRAVPVHQQVASFHSFLPKLFVEHPTSHSEVLREQNSLVAAVFYTNLPDGLSGIS